MTHPTRTRRSPRQSGCQDAGARRAAFTLTELLVATAIALAVMGAVAQLFASFSRGLSQSQNTVDLSGRMRSAAWQLRRDLAGVTASLVPPGRPEANAGYFELIEGPQTDSTLALVSGAVTGNPEGDTDDILLFTTRSRGGPFVGRYGVATIEAPCAEVAWFLRPADRQPVPGAQVYNLHRRQLLVVGYVGLEPFLSNGNAITGVLPNFSYDISLRAEGGLLVPNTLGDLAKRENRFMHGGVFPYPFLSGASATFETTSRAWEDVLLTNVIAFDVKVFDPQVVAQTAIAPALYPGDPGYNPAAATGNVGGYVDLGWALPPLPPLPLTTPFPPANATAFQSGGVRVSNAPALAAFAVDVYDTWSLHYEFNGIDDDGDGLIDEGTNGADDDGDGVPDDAPEAETSAPYPVPLRGLEVRLRCIEPTSRQVRQITIRHAFQRR